MKSELFECGEPDQLLQGMRKARLAIAKGHVVMVPTDTSYALVSNAFKPQAVAALREARGMAEKAPVGVFLPGIPTLEALAEQVPDDVRALAREFWPGALTLIVPARESLLWELGDTKGTVALRMPAHHIILELLSETGPLATSQASLVGHEAGITAEEIRLALGDAVAVYLADDAQVGGEKLSTVIDATSLDRPEGRLRIAREGAIPSSDIWDVVPADRFA